SFGRKAINLLSWCFAPTKVKQVNDCPPVGHMSVFNDLSQNKSRKFTQAIRPLNSMSILFFFGINSFYEVLDHSIT
ncbi:MAG: hypothetical protein ACYS80_19245, partial [Planctomycetota bacterium]